MQATCVVRKAHLVLMAPKARKVRKVRRVCLDKLARKALQAPKVRRAIKALLVRLVKTALALPLLVQSIPVIRHLPIRSLGKCGLPAPPLRAG